MQVVGAKGGSRIGKDGCGTCEGGCGSGGTDGGDGIGVSLCVLVGGVDALPDVCAEFFSVDGDTWVECVCRVGDGAEFGVAKVWGEHRVVGRTHIKTLVYTVLYIYTFPPLGRYMVPEKKVFQNLSRGSPDPRWRKKKVFQNPPGVWEGCAKKFFIFVQKFVRPQFGWSYIRCFLKRLVDQKYVLLVCKLWGMVG